MEIIAINEKYRLFLYHLSELYFDDKDDISIIASEENGSVIIKIKKGILASEGSAVPDIASHFESERAKTVAYGKAFYDAIIDFAKRKVPYGTLVGVRPAKVPLFYLEKGIPESDIAAILQRDYFVDEEKAKLLISIAETERKYHYDNKDAFLYVSVPFCPSRCSYCSFVSVKTEKEDSLISSYLPLLFSELSGIGKLFEEKGLKLRATYIGGGTPGILSAKQIEMLLTEIENDFDISSADDFTFEIGRPDTVTKEKLEVLSKHGIKRISINPQTTSNEVLRAIGRKHSAEDYFKAMESAREIGGFSINSDLIAGLDSDSPQGFLKSVNDIISLAPESITIHALCKKNAATKKDYYFDSDYSEAMNIAHKCCIKSDYQPYYLYRQKNAVGNLENTGFAFKGHECSYNIGMMEDMVNVLSAGAGSAAKILTDNKIERLYSYKYAFEYLKDPEKIELNLKKLYDIL